MGAVRSESAAGKGVEVRNAPLTSATTVDAGLPGPVMDVIQVLWFAAGAAMLLFAAFLAVLILAGIGFRLRRRESRQSPAAVFGMSTVIVVIATAALVLPHSSRGIQARLSTDSRQIDIGQAGARQVALSGIPLRFSGGGASGRGLAPAATRSLILYDTSGPDPADAELNATLLANLVSHFGTWTAQPVARYSAGEAAGYTAVFYLGTPGGPAVPNAFLDDVIRGDRPVTWIDGDIDQLQVRRAQSPAGGYAFTVYGRDTAQLVRMAYKGTQLPMDPNAGGGFTRIGIADPAKVTVLATAQLADGSSVPWALRTGNLTYVIENPVPYQSALKGQNLTFADLLFEALDPAAPARHRALVRLEDVNPTTDPDQLRAIIDYLAGRGVPFSLGVYPVFRDPNGAGGSGTGVTVRLTERPALVSALKYATAHGGTLVLHGYTHQYAEKNNPYNGRSGDDSEFYLCHLDDQQRLHLDGHVPEDSPLWALNRFDQALAEVNAAGLPKPTTVEFPHYMASATDYLAAGARFSYRYERSLYFPGFLSAQPADDARPRWQMFPYAVRDIYGTTVIPENLDYVQGGADSVTSMLEVARQNLVVRDGVASFFYHPILGVGQLPRLVEGIQALGYTFVPAREVAGSS